MARPKGGGGDARERLIEGMGRGFRLGGYGGVGVDGLAKEAGLTSGAFYAQFGSKAEAFTVAVAEGLAFLRRGIEATQKAEGAAWLPAFVDLYLGPRMQVPLSEACALPSFSGDVARSGAETRAAYTAEMNEIARLLATGLGEDGEARAWRLLALLSGAAGMARAVDDEATRHSILEAVRGAALAV